MKLTCLVIVDKKINFQKINAMHWRQCSALVYMFTGSGGDLVVSALAYWFEDPSLFPAGSLTFLCIVWKVENKLKTGWVSPNLKNVFILPSSDSNIHRSVSVSQQPVMGASAIGRRGQFPYAYIRSKLAVLPEEQAGQISRRESMNGRNDVGSDATSNRPEPSQVFAEINSRFRSANMSEEDIVSNVTRSAFTWWPCSHSKSYYF